MCQVQSVYLIDYEQFPDLVYVNLIMIFKDMNVFDVLKIVNKINYLSYTCSKSCVIDIITYVYTILQ